MKTSDLIAPEAPGSVQRSLFSRRSAYQLLAIDARFAKAASWSILATAVGYAFSLLAWVVIGRLLRREDFGLLSLIQSTASTFGVFAGLGLGLTTTKYVAALRNTEPERTGRIIAMTWVISIALSAVLAGVLLIYARNLSGVLGNPVLAGQLLIAAGSVFFNSINGTQLGVLAGFEDFKGIARANFSKGLCSMVLVAPLIGAYGITGANWTITLAALCACATTQASVRAACKRHHIEPRLAGSSREFPGVLGFSVQSFLGAIAITPVTWLASVTLSKQTNGYAALATYSAADKWYALILFVPIAAARSALPLLANALGAREHDRFKKLLTASVVFNVGVTSAGALLVAAASPLLMRLYGKQYAAGWHTLAILAISTVPAVLNTILGQPLVAAGKVHIRLLADVFLGALLLLGVRTLVPSRGADGLALAYLAAYSGSSIFLATYLRAWRHSNA
jgi:O-antigen/teichoic acid export membrane protein